MIYFVTGGSAKRKFHLLDSKYNVPKFDVHYVTISTASVPYYRCPEQPLWRCKHVSLVNQLNKKR